MYLIAPWNHSVAGRRWQTARRDDDDDDSEDARHARKCTRADEKSKVPGVASGRVAPRHFAPRRVALRSVPLCCVAVRFPYLVSCVPMCIGPPHVARRDVALRFRRERRRGAPPPLQAATRLPRMPPLPRRRCASATTRGAVLSPAPAGVWCLRLQSHDGPCAALFHIPACAGAGEGWRRTNLTLNPECGAARRDASRRNLRGSSRVRSCLSSSGVA